MFAKLDYVYAVYKEQSFTRAAEKLYISQPSLSAAIKNVEKEIGAPLFDRTGGSVTLTEIGQEYIEAAEKIRTVREDFIDRIHDIYDLKTGKLSVGGTNHLCSYVLPRIINKFSSLYPKIEVTLVEAKSTTLCEMIASEELDVVVDNFEKVEEYQSYPLTSERILLCVPAELAINATLKEYRIRPDEIYNGTVDLDRIPPVSVAKFKNENFVLLKNGNDMYNRATYAFEKANISPNVSFSVDQMNISYALADSGMGICFVTDTLFRFGRFRDHVFLYNLQEETRGRNLYIAHKRNKYCRSATKKFIEIAKEVLKDQKTF